MNLSVVLVLTFVSSVACRFTSWNAWSVCSVECGVGISSRERIAKRSCGHSEIIERKSCDGKCKRGNLLSKGKPVTASSTFHSTYKTSRVVDGNRNNDFYLGKSCFMTEKNTKPWIMVDLNRPVRVREVVVYNRGDCCQSRLNNMMVTVGNNKDGLKNGLCGERRDMQGVNVTRILCFKPMHGCYVLVTIPGPQFLAVCEIEIYGHKYKYQALDLLSPTGKQSHGRGTVPSKGIDRNINTYYQSKGTGSAWWKVDLGKMAMVKEFIVQSDWANGQYTRGSTVSVWKSSNSGKQVCGRLSIGKGRVQKVKNLKFYRYKLVCARRLKGRYIRVERYNSRPLVFRELYAFGYYL